MGRSYTMRTIKQLFVTAGHYCAFPGCLNEIFKLGEDGPVILGEIAHIEGSSDGGPRANSSLTREERDSYENLIVLCGHHHSLIDKMESDYSVETIKGWKRAAEKVVKEKLSIGATKVTFAELKIVCDAYADGDTEYPSTPMRAVPPQDKMNENSFTDAIRPQMNIGLSLAPQVAEYIRKQAQLSTRFPERLRAGFKQEYDRLEQNGIYGDELFNLLVEFSVNSAASPQDDMARYSVVRAAATGVLCHLFEVCDVFKVPA